MKLLIVGDANTIHFYNYLKVVIKDLKNIQVTIFDITEAKHKIDIFYDYYEKNSMTIISGNSFLKPKKLLPKITLLLRILSMSRALKKLGCFDYCIIHFNEILRVCAVLINAMKYGKIIPVFWGSDLLRNKKIKSFYYQYLFHKAYKIIFNTENMKKTFENIYGDKFKVKTEVIKFPLMSFDKIDILRKEKDLILLKEDFGIPQSKYIVVCGHSGTKEEQYEKLVNAISKCDENIKQKCYFLFLMTYGNIDLYSYQNSIKNLVKEKKIDGQVLCKYMEHNEMLKLFLCSDIYITTITTDAFSGVMQEHLYTGAMLIYGQWLNYLELDNSGIIAKSIQTVDEVTSALEYIVMNLEDFKPKLINNSKIISDISSPQNICRYWHDKVFNTEF